MKLEGKKITKARTKKLQIRLTEQEYDLISTVLGHENISELIRCFLKAKVVERIESNKELEYEIKNNLYLDFFNSK